MLVGIQRVGYRVRCIYVAVPLRVREGSTVEREVDRSRSRRRFRVRFALPFIVSCKSSSTVALDFIKLYQHMKPADNRKRQKTHNMQGNE
jgi:hypothetical protein